VEKICILSGGSLGTIGPVFRSSDDNGATFGPVLRLSANGPIGG
jgi:hypothetical protein